jgi:hypothetical protein
MLNPVDGFQLYNLFKTSQISVFVTGSETNGYGPYPVVAMCHRNRYREPAETTVVFGCRNISSELVSGTWGKRQSYPVVDSGPRNSQELDRNRPGQKIRH